MVKQGVTEIAAKIARAMDAARNTRRTDTGWMITGIMPIAAARSMCRQARRTRRGLGWSRTRRKRILWWKC